MTTNEFYTTNDGNLMLVLDDKFGLLNGIDLVKLSDYVLLNVYQPPECNHMKPYSNILINNTNVDVLGEWIHSKGEVYHYTDLSHFHSINSVNRTEGKRLAVEIQNSINALESFDINLVDLSILTNTQIKLLSMNTLLSTKQLIKCITPDNAQYIMKNIIPDYGNASTLIQIDFICLIKNKEVLKLVLEHCYLYQYLEPDEALITYFKKLYDHIMKVCPELIHTTIGLYLQLFCGYDIEYLDPEELDELDEMLQHKCIQKCVSWESLIDCHNDHDDTNRVLIERFCELMKNVTDKKKVLDYLNIFDYTVFPYYVVLDDDQALIEFESKLISTNYLHYHTRGHGQALVYAIVHSSSAMKAMLYNNLVKLDSVLTGLIIALTNLNKG